MKIYACIPSLNESLTIESVTKFVDEGLQLFCSKYCPTATVRIFNIDSSSDDATSLIFDKTQTHYPKESLILDKPRGKGKNLLEFMKRAYKDHADYCVTIDADIRSGNPAWITDLLLPLFNREADFITPLYQRSRFEGSTTNHFAYPVTLALTGVRVRQPIAGDFGFNYALLNVVNNLDSIPDGANYYGIDVFLTLSTLLYGLQHKQIDLGSKIHNPSHPKLEYMFPQIAQVELAMLRNTEIKKNPIKTEASPITNITESKIFLHKENAQKMFDMSLSRLASENLQSWRWVPDTIIKKIKSQTGKDFSDDDWVVILSSWLHFGFINKNIDDDLLARQLLPFFVIRAVSFWFLSENLTAQETEKLIEEQAVKLYDSFFT